MPTRRARIPGDESRTVDQLREHYEIERELADRLRNATRDERRELYGSVYNELFLRVPLHPQLVDKAAPEARAWATERQLSLVMPFLSLQSTFLEVGAGDCALSAAVAPHVRKVYAVDVSEEIVAELNLPANVEVRISDGIEIPLEAGTVDVAYSDQVMEHLHPEDALDQVRGIYDALRPVGVYVCVTPNRLSGPHDISKYFDDVPSGFHLQEYTVSELDRMFTRVGFKSVSVYVGGRGRYFRVGPRPIELFEAILGSLPHAARRTLAHPLLVSGLLGARVVAVK
jgi:SAM-dependent methyltransferase